MDIDSLIGPECPLLLPTRPAKLRRTPRFTHGLPRQEVGGGLVGMTNALREELFKLSAAERLELVEELWDSIADEHEALALTDEQREDLERRLAEADADPSGGSPWEDVRERIRHRPR